MAQPVPEPAPVFTEMRAAIFALSPDEIGVPPAAAQSHVWGVLMETGYPEAVATLVALADTTTSLYLSHGGGIIGGGEHADVQQPASAFLARAEADRENLQPTDNYPLPDVGRVRFYLLTFSGVLTAEAGEEDLGEHRHVLSGLFHAGHGVIAQLIRFVEGAAAES